MGTAAREVLSSGGLYNNSVYSQNISPISGSISSLRSKISTGNIVYAADINLMRDLTNGWIGHFHSFNDIYQAATYGNNGDRNTYTVSKNSSGISFSTIGTTVNSTDIILASTHNTLKDAIATIRSHNHPIDDRTA